MLSNVFIDFNSRSNVKCQVSRICVGYVVGYHCMTMNVNNNNNFVESDGTAISESDGPTSRLPRLEDPVTAPAVTDVEKGTVMESGSNRTSQSDGEATATASSAGPSPAPGEPMPGARELTPADADSTTSTACGPHDRQQFVFPLSCSCVLRWRPHRSVPHDCMFRLCWC